MHGDQTKKMYVIRLEFSIDLCPFCPRQVRSLKTRSRVNRYIGRHTSRPIYQSSLDRVSTESQMSIGRVSTDSRPIYRPIYRLRTPTVNMINTEVITRANQKRQNCKYMQPTRTPSFVSTDVANDQNTVVLVLFLISSDGDLRYLDQSQSKVNQNRCDPGFLFDS